MSEAGARGVAKVIVSVHGFGPELLLFSRKKAKGTPKHGRLELLGGGMDEDDPLEALVRELDEEEKTGTLAKKVRWEQPGPRTIHVDGETHYIFEIAISLAEYIDLQHSRKESMGLKVVPRSALSDGELYSRLTTRTQKILAALSTAPEAST
jgi:hypothetical protein